jgi:lipid A 3-O-deacylase
MKSLRHTALAALALLPVLAAFAGAAHADWRPDGAFAEAGRGTRGAYSVTAGGLWDWDWKRDFPVGQVSGVTEAFVSHWSARQLAGGREGFNQIGLQPLFRLRFDRGQSPWFVEGGIGVTYMDKLYTNEGKLFSTRFQFIDSLGAGRSFGKSEVSLRLTHQSNAGIKSPNPGENFVQLRYAVRF